MYNINLYNVNFPHENFSDLDILIHTIHMHRESLEVIVPLMFLSLSLLTGPNCSDLKQPMYLGFEKDVFKTIADYYGHLKEPLLTFYLFDAFVSVLGKLKYNEHVSVLLTLNHFIFYCLETSISQTSIAFLLLF